MAGNRIVPHKHASFWNLGLARNNILPWHPSGRLSTKPATAGDSQVADLDPKDWQEFARLSHAALDLMMGYTGLISFGHAAYFGLGAYASAVTLTQTGLPLLFVGSVAGEAFVGKQGPDFTVEIDFGSGCGRQREILKIALP